MVTKVIDIDGNKTVVNDDNTAGRRIATYYGLSDDTKPVNARNADIFYEMDTGKTWFFDEGTGSWFERRAT